MKKILSVVAVSIALAFASAIGLSTIYAEGLDPFPSTNSNNQATDQPYVEFVSHTANSVTLNFVNPKNHTVSFEYQKDNSSATGASNPNPCKPSADPLPNSCGGKRYIADDDEKFPTFSLTGGETREETVTGLSEKVSIRMTFGPERDWDFDWVTFDVYNPDPENKHQMSLGGYVYRDHKSDDCFNKTSCEDKAENLGAGWDINLYKENSSGSWDFVKSAQTNSEGVFSFSSVKEAGTYHACEVLKVGWKQQLQTWSGSGFLVATDNLSGNSEEGPYCRTINYDDTKNYSNKFQFGNVDTKKPVTEVLSPDSGLTFTSGALPVVDAKSTDGESGIVKAVINLYRAPNTLLKSCVNQTVSPAEAEHEFSCDLSTLSSYLMDDGQYLLKVNSKDAGDNTSNTVIWNFTINNSDDSDDPGEIVPVEPVVDDVAPAKPVITTPTARQWFKASPITNSWSAVTTDINGDPESVDYYQIAYNYDDGHSFGGSTCPDVEIAGVTGFIGCRDVNGTSRNHSPSGSEQGGVTIWVRAVDTAGNVGAWSKSVHYYFDNTAPGTDINVSPVVNGVFTVSGTATDNLSLNRVYVQLVSRVSHARCGGTTIHLIGTGTTSPWSREYNIVDLGESCPAGNFAAHVSVTDMAGNSSTAGWTDNFDVQMPEGDDGEGDENENPVQKIVETVIVTSDNLEGWSLATLAEGETTFEEDDTAVLGEGSLKFVTTDNNSDRAGLNSPVLDVFLSTVESLSYKTNQVSAADITNGNATIRVWIDTDGDGELDDQLMYEPYYNGFNGNTMTDWQTWLITPTSGKFWSNYGESYNGLGATPAGAYATNFTLEDVLVDYPTAKIIGISVTMGTWNPSQIVLVDAVNLVTDTYDVTYDFEPSPMIPVPGPENEDGEGTEDESSGDGSEVVGSGGFGGGSLLFTPGTFNAPTTPPTTGSVLGATAYQFTRDLRIGSTGAEVKALQKFLNLKGFTVASAGTGSIGNETEYFGSLTRAAVIRYQEANPVILTRVEIYDGRGTGNFFWSTRGFVNEVLLTDSATSQALQD